MNCLILFVFSVILNVRPNLVKAIPATGPLTYNPYDEYPDYDQMPKSCQEKKLTYCVEKGDNYPDDLVENALKDMHNLEVNSEPTPRITDMTEYRLGGKNDNTTISIDCPYETKDERMYYIIDKDNNVRVVIQSAKLYQSHTLRQCIYEGPIKRQTKSFLSNSPILKNNDIQCKTSKMEVDFIVLNDDDYHNPKLERVKIKDGIPICCKCVLL